MVKCQDVEILKCYNDTISFQAKPPSYCTLSLSIIICFVLSCCCLLFNFQSTVSPQQLLLLQGIAKSIIRDLKECLNCHQELTKIISQLSKCCLKRPKLFKFHFIITRLMVMKNCRQNCQNCGQILPELTCCFVSFLVFVYLVISLSWSLRLKGFSVFLILNGPFFNQDYIATVFTKQSVPNTYLEV